MTFNRIHPFNMSEPRFRFGRAEAWYTLPEMATRFDPARWSPICHSPLKFTLGDELHPRTSIRKRQLMELARAGFDRTHLWRRHEEMEAEKSTIRAEKEATAGAPEEQRQST
jgi:hypothetical protein